MTPDQFLVQMSPKGGGRLAAVYLFLGPEMHQRDQCKSALLDGVLGAGEREGYFHYDLEQTPMAAICDDAAAYSLFSQRRVFWITRAEAVLPRGRAAAAAADDSDDDDAGSASKKPGAAAADALARYLKNPSQDTVLVFDSHKFEFDGEDKAKVDRLRKFYAGVPATVEFPRWTAAMARKLAQDRARELGLQIASDDLTVLVDAVAGSPGRVLVELEKLSLFATSQSRGGKVGPADIAALVPQAQATTVFALVAALGRGDRQKALPLLDVLIREGEYLPLALSFLATQFRQALVAQEAQLKGAGQIVAHFAKSGVPMWPSRAEQVAQTMTAFTPNQLKTALGRIALADKALRDIRPDDRTVLEEFVLAVTAAR
jgi:DNA polymerase-3 subunit delta